MRRKLTLCFETATPVCSVALVEGIATSQIIAERSTDKRGAHAELLPLLVQEVLAEKNATIADIQTVLISAGPGSYTGLRIGASLVKGLFFARDVQFAAINTLTGIAFGAQNVSYGNSIHAVVDARRTHLYHQQYVWRENRLQPVESPKVRELDEITQLLNPSDIIAGTGWKRLSDNGLQSMKCVGLESISARNLIKVYELEVNINPETQDAHPRMIWHPKMAEFEPDYRGNPYE